MVERAFIEPSCNDDGRRHIDLLAVFSAILPMSTASHTITIITVVVRDY